LGVTFSSICKWHCHIQNILKSTSGQLSMLRKFKIKLTISFILEDEYDSDVSSANNRERLWISSVISLIYNMNSKGPNTVPCGTYI
jgi:hypothetical protein